MRITIRRIICRIKGHRYYENTDKYRVIARRPKKWCLRCLDEEW